MADPLTTKVNEAESLKDNGDLDGAIRLLDEVLEADANHVIAHMMVSRYHTLAQNFDLAIEHGLKACELEPTEPMNFTALSVTYQRAWAGTQEQKFITLAEEAMAKARTLEG